MVTIVIEPDFNDLIPLFRGVVDLMEAPTSPSPVHEFGIRSQKKLTDIYITQVIYISISSFYRRWNQCSHCCHIGLTFATPTEVGICGPGLAF